MKIKKVSKLTVGDICLHLFDDDDELASIGLHRDDLSPDPSWSACTILSRKIENCAGYGAYRLHLIGPHGLKQVVLWSEHKVQVV